MSVDAAYVYIYMCIYMYVYIYIHRVEWIAHRGLVGKCDEGNTWKKICLVGKIMLKMFLDTDN
jgi:hypothetical protein